VVFPDRMWKMPDMPVYGREVTIKIPEDNSFLLGEMVTISEEGKIKDLATRIMEALFGNGDE
jgi:HlyD family secretion protein